MAESRMVISAGQCGYDNGRLRSLIRSINPDLIFHATDSAAETERLIEENPGSIALVLVNRVFDANGQSGLELIQTLTGKQAESRPHVMLVSNYEDAQAMAIAHGALPGFGKSALGDSRTADRIKSALEIN